MVSVEPIFRLGRFFINDFEYLLNIPGEMRPELVEGRWFRQAQPTPPRFFEKIRFWLEKATVKTCQVLSSRNYF
jgi:hypothetical protein